MQKKLDINGMICAFCAEEVRKALLSVPGVCCAKALPDEAVAYVKLCGEVEDAALQAAVEAKGYDLVSIQTIEEGLCDEREQEG